VSFQLTKIGQEKWLTVRALVANLNAADPVYVELRADVQRLLHPPPIPGKARSDMSVREYWLRAIGRKILAMNVTHGRKVQRLGDWPYLWKPHRLRLGDEVFIYTASPAKALLSVSRGERKRRMAYWLLDQTLLPGGGFSQVKRCRSCPKYFATTRSDRVSCGPECNVKYQNTQRRGSDSNLDYFTYKRWEQRKSAVEKALRLERDGKSAKEAARLSNLSERVLRKERTGRGLMELLKRARERGETQQWE
jgi:hypothetical protein